MRDLDTGINMSEAHILLEEQEKDNVVSFELIKGGKDSGGSDDGLCWLLGLEEQTAFLVEETHAGVNMPRYLVLQFYLAKKFQKAVLLINAQQQELFVNPYRFCSQYKLYELLYDPKTMPPITFEEEKQNEPGDRASKPRKRTKDKLDSVEGVQGRFEESSPEPA